jgi:predicted nucleic acid binding AN1-type Zn finger protein
VNARTVKRPFYRVIRGTNLGPGGAEILQASDNSTLFNLAKRKQVQKKASSGTAIKSIGLCIELPRVYNAKPTSKKPRRLDFYIRI